MSRRATRTTFASAACAALLAGCGVETDGTPVSTAPTTGTTAATSTQATTGPTGPQGLAALQARLPKRPAGTVAVDGRTASSLGREGATGFAAGGGSARVAFTRSNEDRAYQNLCAGRVDAIEVTTLPSQGIVDLCVRRGIELVDPIQLASDAIVLATKNESDVGGDCITAQQANEVFRSGSTISNWSQLGFDDLPLRATGREPESDVFQFFGQLVLNRTESSLADVRSDYIAHASDPRERREVTNQARLESAERRAARYRARLRDRTLGARRRFVAAAERIADRRMLAEIERVNARNRRLKITVDGAALAARNSRLVETAKRRARLRANAAYDARLNEQVARYRREQLGSADQAGTVGFFRFSYYELFEEKLRPLEIDFGVPETESGQPVRYGDLSDGDQAKLADAVRRAIATRNAGTSAAATTGAAGATTIDPETSLAGIQNLPSKDRNGKTIYSGPGCVFPAQTTITSGVYPLTQRFFVVTSKLALARREVKAYLDYLVSQSRDLAVRNRLVPITDQQVFDELTTVRGRKPSEQEVTGTEPADVAPTTTTTTTAGSSGTSTTATATPAPTGVDSGIPGVSSRGG